jgi:hypothetical protein
MRLLAAAILTIGGLVAVVAWGIYDDPMSKAEHSKRPSDHKAEGKGVSATGKTEPRPSSGLGSKDKHKQAGELVRRARGLLTYVTDKIDPLIASRRADLVDYHQKMQSRVEELGTKDLARVKQDLRGRTYLGAIGEIIHTVKYLEKKKRVLEDNIFSVEEFAKRLKRQAEAGEVLGETEAAQLEALLETAEKEEAGSLTVSIEKADQDAAANAYFAEHFGGGS